MNINERDGDVIELGAVSVETHGSAPLGINDVQPGGKIFVGGIESDI